MNTGLTRPVMDCLGWTLVHFLWQGLVIAIVLALGRSLLRRNPPNHRYLAGCLALALMAAAPVETFHFVAQRYVPAPSADPVPASAASSRPVTRPPSSAPKLLFLAIPMTSERNFTERLEILLPWVVTGWLAGVLGLSCRLVFGWVQIKRLERHATESLAEPCRAKLTELADRLDIRRPLRLLQSAWVEVPTVIGWLRPVILLPSSCLLGLAPAQLESILAHELAHIRRHDYPINLLQSVVETVLFYHPAVWWVSRRIREDRENCCDDLAVEICGDRLAYVRALATLEELRQAPAQLALAAAGAPLLQRIRRLLAQPDPTAGRPGCWWAGAILAAGIMALTVGFRGDRAVAADGEMPAANDQSSQTITNENSAETTAQSEAGPAHFARTNFDKPILGFWEASANDATAGQGRKTILSKLDRIRIASIHYDSLPLSEVIRDLSAAAKSGDPDGTGINFLVDQGPPDRLPGSIKIDPNTGLPAATPPLTTTHVGAIKVRINPALTDLRLRDVLDAIVKTADQPIKYSILDYAVVFSLRGEEPVWLEVRTFRVGREGLIHLANGSAKTNGLALPDIGLGSQPQGESENATKGIQIALRRFFAGLGIDFNTNDPTNAGKIFVFDDRTRTLIVRSTARDLNEINAAIQTLDGNSSRNAPLGTQSANVLPTSAPKPSTSTNLIPGHTLRHNVSARTNQIWTTERRQNIVSNLFRIKIASIKYHHVPLAEVIKNLGELARSGDPEHVGIHLLLDRTPVSRSQDRPADLGDVRININPTITNLRLGDALDAIVKTADQPIKYSILNFGVIFAFKNQEPTPLEIRVFRLDPNAFGQRFGSSSDLPSGNVLSSKEGETGITTNAVASRLALQVHNFLLAAGADFSTNNPANAGKTFIFNERKGTLTVRSTPQDLDMIEAVMQSFLNGTPIQTQSGTDSASKRAATKPGAINTSGTSVQGKSGAIDEAWPGTTALTPAEPAEPPLSSLELRTFHFDADRVLAGLNITGKMDNDYKFSRAIQEVAARADVDSPTGNSNHARVWIGHDLRRELTVRATPAELDRIGAVLDELQPRPQFNIRMRFVEINEAAGHSAGVDWLPGRNGMSPVTNQAERLLEMPVDPPGGNHPIALPKIVVTNSLTESFAGVLTAEQSRAAMKALEQHDGIDILSAPGITTEAGREARVSVTSPTTVVTGVSSTPISEGKVKIDYRTQSIRCGFMLDVVPQVSADGNSLDLKLKVSKSEFQGYAAPPGGLENWPGQIASPGAVKPLPHFRMQQLATRKTVNDGQTIVLTGFTSEEVIVARDKVPVLGDVPLLGRLFRRSYSSRTRKNLLVLVTPTLIYPDGARYNSDLQLSRLNPAAVPNALSAVPATGN